jgi:glucose/arabinose dehydrogenase
MKRLLTLILLATASICLPSGCSGRQEVQLDKIKLPPGFHISIYADNVPNARSMVLSPNRTLFVGTREDNGSVYAIPDRNKDYRGDEVITIARNLFMPNGVDLHNGSLYVAEVNRILRFDDVEADLANPPKPVVVTTKLPSSVHHGWKYIRFGPDDLLYVPIGAPCNICDHGDPFASLTRMNADGSGAEIFARGIRNTVGFDWDPQTKELWFTDNGRDWLGENRPPDELNHAPTSGMHFGYPYRHGKDIVDPDFGSKGGAAKTTPATVELGPHVAALGMRFYTGKMFPPAYKNQIFICEHGSWNRSTPLGYRISLVRRNKGEEPKYEVFADGWLEGGKVWGRPVDILIAPDGSLLISDDKAGCIYRITYANP